MWGKGASQLLARSFQVRLTFWTATAYNARHLDRAGTHVRVPKLHCHLTWCPQRLTLLSVSFKKLSWISSCVVSSGGCTTSELIPSVAAKVTSSSGTGDQGLSELKLGTWSHALLAVTRL